MGKKSRNTISFFRDAEHKCQGGQTGMGGRGLQSEIDPPIGQSARSLFGAGSWEGLRPPPGDGRAPRPGSASLQQACSPSALLRTCRQFLLTRHLRRDLVGLGRSAVPGSSMVHRLVLAARPESHSHCELKSGRKKQANQYWSNYRETKSGLQNGWVGFGQEDPMGQTSAGPSTIKILKQMEKKTNMTYSNTTR